MDPRKQPIFPCAEMERENAMCPCVDISSLHQQPIILARKSIRPVAVIMYCQILLLIRLYGNLGLLPKEHQIAA